MHMNAKTIFITIILLTTTIPSSIKSEIEEPSMRGTLILATSCSEGVVMCSDTRLIQGYKKPVSYDHVQKLRPIGLQGMYAISGIPIILDESDTATSIMQQRRLFDVNKIVDDFFKEHAPKDLDKNILELKKILINKTVEFFYSHPKIADILIENHAVNNTDKSLYQILIYVVNNHKEISGYKLNGFLINGSESRSFKVKVERFTKDFFTIADLSYNGRIEVINKIFKEHDPNFNDILRDPDIKLFSSQLKRNKSTKDISVKQVTTLQEKLIKITNDKLPLLGLEVSVGPYCDCAILNPKSGFKWLKKDSSKK